MYSPYWLLTYPLVWAIVLSIPKVMRRPNLRIKQYSSHTFFVLSAFIWELGSIKEIVMKKLFTTLLLLMNILPAFAYVRDDTEEGWSLGGTLLFFAILIIGAIVSLKNQDKNN